MHRAALVLTALIIAVLTIGLTIPAAAEPAAEGDGTYLPLVVNPPPPPTAVPPTAVPPTAVPPTAIPPSCDPAYPTVCIPSPPPDLDCGDIPYRRFTVLPPDPHNFDSDGDGVGCESG